MKPAICLFDLDGTLTDSSEGILNSVTYALKKMNYPVPARETLGVFIGPPLLRTFANFCGMTPEEAAKAVACYREYYPVKGIFEAKVYSGVRELLARLCDAGITLVLATCKPTPFAQRVIDHFQLSQFFSFVAGPDFNGTRDEKDQVIAYAFEQLHVTNRSEVVMIGDRKDDMLGAAKNGVRALGVLWGFGSEAELKEAGAANVFQNPQSLGDFILQENH